jgi:hypothetical protein
MIILPKNKNCIKIGQNIRKFKFWNSAFVDPFWLSDSVFYIKKSVSFGSFYINAFLSLVEESMNIE